MAVMMGKRLDKLQYTLVALMVILIALVFYRFTYQNYHRIQVQNETYGEDAAIQTATRVDAQFKGAQDLINTYAAVLSATLDSPDVTTSDLANIETSSPFDAVRFTDKKGINLASSGQLTDTHEQEYFQQGMQGKSGVTAVFRSWVYNEPILAFYTPVRYHGEIIGVLHGVYKISSYMANMLDSYYFGEPAAVFLCTSGGRVIATSHGKLYPGKLLDALQQDKMIDKQAAEQAEVIFQKGGHGDFPCSPQSQLDNISVVHLRNYDFVLVQAFPRKVTSRMVNAANKSGIDLEISLLAIFALYAAFVMWRWRRQKKVLEKENALFNSAVQGMSTVFSSRLCLVNMADGSFIHITDISSQGKTREVLTGQYADIISKLASEILDPAERKSFCDFFALGHLAEALVDRDVAAYICHVRRNGKDMWENVVVSCVERNEGRPATLIFMRQDITESKQREEQSRRQIANMNRKERQYSLAVTSNALFYYELNVTKNVITEDITQRSRDGKLSVASVGLSLPCKASDFMAVWPPRILPESEENYYKIVNVNYLLQCYQEGRLDVDIDYWAEDDNGREMCIRQAFYLSRDDISGDITAMCVVREITEQVMQQRAQTRALEDALQQARRANEAKTTFLSNMSHDIRTPMNAIIGFTTIAASHLDNRAQAEDCLRKVLSSSNHLLSLINDILDMSHIESGKMQLKEQACNLSELMHNLVNIIQPQATSKQMKLFIDTFSVSNEDVLADPLKLNQIFINLLGNAVKYTPAGGTVSFTIGQKPAFRHGYADYVFIVRDNGIGMSREFVEHIFEPFSRESTTTQTGIEGTGLGMAITRNIVDMMGGTITVDSVQGKGSAFTVTLTLKLLENKKEHKRIDELKGLRTLVVDDDFHVCDSVDKMLKKLGLRSEWTTSGREAVYRTQIAMDDRDPYNTYIIDWQMPGMNGVETAREIRRIAGDVVPIVILTAYSWADIEEDARKAGVTAFCAKPLFMSDLSNALLSSHNLLDSGKSENSLDTEFLVGKRVLLVEDMEINRELAEFILTEGGLEVESVPDGTDAVTKVKETPENYFDAILMDVQMPTMNGYEATKAIRQIARADIPNLPIIAMTANAMEEDKAMALSCGMNAHISKPIDVKKLFATLKNLLTANQKQVR